MRTTQETVRAFLDFQGPDDKIVSFYCDNAPELKACLLEAGCLNPLSTPACPQTNGMAEAKVKDAKNGTRCQHLQSGFHKSWWERAAPTYAFHRNIIPKSRWEGDPLLSAYERRHGEKCKAVLFFMGELVDFMKTPFPQNTPAPFEARTIPGLFAGYYALPGGKWSGDYYAVEYAPFQKDPEMTLGQARKYIHRVKEVRKYKENGRTRFPLGERRAAIARLPPQLLSLIHI